MVSQEKPPLKPSDDSDGAYEHFLNSTERKKNPQSILEKARLALSQLRQKIRHLLVPEHIGGVPYNEFMETLDKNRASGHEKAQRDNSEAILFANNPYDTQMRQLITRMSSDADFDFVSWENILTVLNYLHSFNLEPELPKGAIKLNPHRRGPYATVEELKQEYRALDSPDELSTEFLTRKSLTFQDLPYGLKVVVSNWAGTRKKIVVSHKPLDTSSSAVAEAVTYRILEMGGNGMAIKTLITQENFLRFKTLLKKNI